MSLATFHARVLQMGMPDVFAKLTDAGRRVFLAIDESVMRIPEQSDMRRASFLEYFAKRWSIREVSVRFQQDSDVLGACIVPKFAQRCGNMLERRGTRSNELVAENAHVGSGDLRGEVNEPPRVSKLLFVLLASTVQIGRTAHAGNSQSPVGDLLLGLFKSRRPKFGARRKVHRSLHSAKFHSGKTVLLGEVENLEPVPGRATERRKTDRQAPARSVQGRW